MEIDLGNFLIYLFLAISIISIAYNVLLMNVYAVMTASFFSIAGILTFYFWPFIEAALIRKTNFIQVLGSFELSSGRKSALIKRNGRYHASAACTLEKLEDEIERDKIEDIISHSDFPFKFSICVKNLNTKSILESIETKKYAKEIELSRLPSSSRGKDPLRSIGLRNAINALSEDIDSIKKGKKPVYLAYYLVTVGSSENKFFAEELAISRLKTIANEFSFAFKAKFNMLEGDQLIELLKMDSGVGE
jgi:hypothetical protein